MRSTCNVGNCTIGSAKSFVFPEAALGRAGAFLWSRSLSVQGEVVSVSGECVARMRN